MQSITITTTFDITNTDIVRNYKEILMKSHPTINTEAQWIKARRQQQNFETILQVVSLRAQPTVTQKPVRHKNKWRFTFTVEFDGVYETIDNKLGLLIEDFQNVPMNINLTEKTTDEYIEIDKNLWIKSNVLQ